MSTENFIYVDAHHHLWDLNTCHYPWLMARGKRRFFGDPTPIQQNYLVEDFLSESHHYHPTHSVHIQVGVADADVVRETAWLQAQTEFPQAIVAFCDLSKPDVADVLLQHQAHDKLRGIRQIVGRHPAENTQRGTQALLDNPNWLAGLRLLAKNNLSFDLQLIPPQIPALRSTLEQVPELAVAICHCASPWDQSTAGLARWRDDLSALAELPNTVCKVSGLGMFNPSWTQAELEPVVHSVIDLFSPKRVMFGSNFPVDKLYRSYDALWDAYRGIAQRYTTTERQHMFSATAISFYRLNSP